MKKRRVLVIMHVDLVPPEDATTTSVCTDPEMQSEWDVVTHLREAGHDVHTLGLDDDLAPLRQSIAGIEPHVVFNMLEEFAGRAIFDQNVVSFLELMGVPYTGCGPEGLILSRNKALSKKILHYHRIATPAFAVFRRGRAVRRPKTLDFPLLVKSLSADASEGISQASVVTTDAELRERVDFIHRRVSTHALAEQYVDGRELYVSVLGNERLEVFPTWEMVFENMPDGAPKIATERIKWDPGYQQRRGITTLRAQGLSADVEERLHKIARRVFRRLDQAGFARVDFRLREDGRPFVLEVNSNPNIADLEDFAMSAYEDDIEYPDLLGRIMSLGIRRARKRYRSDRT